MTTIELVIWKAEFRPDLLSQNEILRLAVEIKTLRLSHSQLTQLVTTDHESKESFIERVRHCLVSPYKERPATGRPILIPSETLDRSNSTF